MRRFFSFYCINVCKILLKRFLFRHCSASVNTVKAISGDFSANIEMSKRHGEYRFKLDMARVCLLVG